VLARYLAPLRQADSPPLMAPGAPTGHVFTDLWQDVRYATRTLRKHANLHARGRPDAGARHRVERRHLLHHQRRSASAATVSEQRAARGAVLTVPNGVRL
jgi:hypothetical protein